VVDSTPAGEYLLSISQAWNFSQFGLEKFEDLLDVIRDTVSMGEQDFMKAAMEQCWMRVRRTWVLKNTWRFPFWKMGVPPVLIQVIGI
jgi:hypothetical protein